jgi:hypothetical protein
LRWFGKILDPKLTQVRILVLSDLHYGNPYCSVKHFQRTIDYVKANKDVHVFFNGDLCESAIKTSKGDIFHQVGTPQDQRDWVIQTLAPIKKQILGFTTGNHENRIYNDTGIDLTADIAAAFEVPYRSEGMLFKLSFGSGSSSHDDKPFVFGNYITHGFGGARTKAAKATKIERASTWVDADWYAMSHDHVVNVAPDIYLQHDDRGTVDKTTGYLSGKVTAKRKMLIKTNAFLKWGGYAESGGFPPSDLATPLIWLLTPKSPAWQLFPDKPRQAVKVTV